MPRRTSSSQASAAAALDQDHAFGARRAPIASASNRADLRVAARGVGGHARELLGRAGRARVALSSAAQTAATARVDAALQGPRAQAPPPCGLTPSASKARVSTIAVAVPSPTASLVRQATSRSAWTPRFSSAVGQVDLLARCA